MTLDQLTQLCNALIRQGVDPETQVVTLDEVDEDHTVIEEVSDVAFKYSKDYDGVDILDDGDLSDSEHLAAGHKKVLVIKS